MPPSSKKKSSRAIRIGIGIGIIPEQQQLSDCHRHHQYRNTQLRSIVKNTDCNNSNNNGKDEARTKLSISFDPAMNWKTETQKAEHRHLRRTAEKEIKKRINAIKKRLQKGKNPGEWRQDPQLLAELQLSKNDRQKEVFLYICFCDINLLVGQYEHHCDKFVVARLFDRLFQEAGITTLSERKKQKQRLPGSSSVTCNDSDSIEEKTSSSRLWTCFFALQLEYRRLNEKNTSTTYNILPATTTSREFVSGLSPKADQALFFIHWLSPVFRYEEKEFTQTQVYSFLLGDSKTTACFQEYLFRDIKSDNEEESMNDLRRLVHGFFGTLVYSSVVTSSSLHESSMMGADLITFFVAIRECQDHANNTSCDWPSCCYNKEDSQDDLLPLFPYNSLACESKYRLFLIGAMPAFRTCLAKSVEGQQIVVAAQEQQQYVGTNRCSELLRSPFPCFSFSGNSGNESSNCVSGEQDPISSKNDINTHCDFMAQYNYNEHEFMQEICSLIFESA